MSAVCNALHSCTGDIGSKHPTGRFQAPKKAQNSIELRGMGATHPIDKNWNRWTRVLLPLAVVQCRTSAVPTRCERVAAAVSTGSSVSTLLTSLTSHDRGARLWNVKELHVANHASAVKRARQNQKRRARNLARKTQVRTLIKKVRAALTAKDAKAAAEALPAAVSALAKSVTKNVTHKRTAARKIARLTKQANNLKK